MSIRTTALEVFQNGMLFLLFVCQVVMNFVVYFIGNDYYTITVNVVDGCFILLIIFELVTIKLKKQITKKWKFILRTQMFYLPNYIMGAFVLYTYRQANKLEEQTDALIFYGAFRFVLQLVCNSFLTTKEFIDFRVYIIGMLSVTVWITFVIIGVVQAILQKRTTYDQNVQQKLALLSASLTTGIARSIMEYYKNSFQIWRFQEKKKAYRNSVINMANFHVQQETQPGQTKFHAPLNIELMNMRKTKQQIELEREADELRISGVAPDIKLD